jgi:Dna[CI] antecedent DciA-like protein
LIETRISAQVLSEVVKSAKCRKMQNTKTINELLSGTKRLSQLKSRSEKRSRILVSVREALPPHLAHAVVTAGVDEGRLSIGVVSGVWASRIRYFLPMARAHLHRELGISLVSARVRVITPL